MCVSVVNSRLLPPPFTVLATASADHTVKLWDIDAGEEKVTLNGHEQTLQDIVFNYNGSQLATSCKDKKMRIFDPRTDSVVQECQPHDGSKCFKITYLGKDTNHLVSVGFTRQSKRQFKVWDSRNLTKHVHLQDIDQAAGVIMPFYDVDSKVLFLGGKGDGNIRFYEMVPEKPFTFHIGGHKSTTPHKGLCFVPRRHCRTNICEVARAFKLTRNSVEPLSFIIPRKSDRFQADIYPDTYAGVPGMSSADFFGGKDIPEPPLTSMDPKKRGSASAGESKSSASSLKSKSQLQSELKAANARIKELEAEIAKLKA